MVCIVVITMKSIILNLSFPLPKRGDKEGQKANEDRYQQTNAARSTDLVPVLVVQQETRRMRHKPPTPPALEPSRPYQHPARWWLSPISGILVAVRTRFLVPATRIVNATISPQHTFQTPRVSPPVLTARARHLSSLTTPTLNKIER